MFNPSSTTLIRNCCYFFMLIFITSTCAYVIDSNELRNSLAEQQFGLHAPSYADRYIRTTKFPRIGRSPSDLEENVEFDSNIRFDEIDDNNENEIRLLEQRSVLFPRIGKRAFHNIIWGNSYSNPHRTLDSQGRYHINGYDYQPYPNYSPPVTHVRGKRNLSS